MIKNLVKKPFLVVVAVIIVLLIGAVSLNQMKTDLLPKMDIPYMIVVTTEPGASPKKVENDVTAPLESLLGTVNGVEKITSQSQNNYSMVMLRFEDDTDMESALVRVSKVIDTAQLPEECSKPNIMEVSMDMMATVYLAVDYKGKDIKELSDFSKNTIQPYFERQDGVASITPMGITTDSVEIKLNQDKVDRINTKILGKTNKSLADAQDKLDEAKRKMESGKSQITANQNKLKQAEKDTNKKLAKVQVQLTKAQASKAAYEANLKGLEASKSALEGEKKAYEKAKIKDTYNQINTMLATVNAQMAPMAQLTGIEVPTSIKDAVENKDKFDTFVAKMKEMGQGDKIEKLKYSDLKKLYNIVEVRYPQIETGLANLKTETMAAKAVVDAINSKIKDLDKNNEKAIAGSNTAISQFATGGAALTSAQSQLETYKKTIEDAEKNLKDSRQAAIDNSNINALLTLETLSGLVYAQNFSMPAGYIDDKKDNQWLVDVGDNYDNLKAIKNQVITKIKGVGTIKISDIADVTIVDNAGESYSKSNGRDGVLLGIFKASTANTSEVAKNIKEAKEELEDEYKGLTITPIVDQSEYISKIVSAVLKSILLGALLAIFVLALFLKDVKPTIIVAFSIPFSVLFAILIMYFTNITLNVMSLGGLCLGIGMLVDNSIVVMENIYRLRGKGISAPRAAVQGAKQVAAPIIASTITTICVFMPMVYVKGTVADLLIPFAFTISYSLIASLIVALTVVPTISATVLKKTKPIKHNLFDKIQNVYGKSLAWCLKVKIVPLVVAIVLFVICVAQVFRTGLVMLDDMESNQISVSLQMEDDVERETAYKTADKVMSAIMKVDGVNKVSAMDGNAGATSGITGSTENFTRFNFYVIADEDITSSNEFKRIIKDIEKETKGIKCKKLDVASSAMGSMSSMMNQGVQVNIYGDDTDKLIDISKDVMKIVKKAGHTKEIKNGIDQNAKQVHINVDKNKAAKYGLTVAQIYQQLAAKITTEKKALTVTINDKEMDVNIVNENDVPKYEKILKTEITATTKDETGKDVVKKYKLGDFAKKSDGDSLASITRENQSRYLAVTATVDEGSNATIISRTIESKLKDYKAPAGYTIEVQGEYEQVMDMIVQMLLALLLGLVLVYLVMVAQFQSLLSPFIILFTVPLAFTGGMIGLMVFGMSVSAMALMGFMILMGTVVNNGIVFVDYANNLRIAGLDKKTALVVTGKTRMRPILMTAITTILSMSVMVFSTDAGNAMQKSMAVVVSFGLLYATFMTLYIVPVLYDIMYRRKPLVIDIGDDNIDDIPDETSEILNEIDGK